MWEGEARRLLDEAVARTLAERTAWVRQFVRAGDDAPRPDDLRLQGAGDLRRRGGGVAARRDALRLEGAVDLRRRVAVVAEAEVPRAGMSPFETARVGPARDLLEAFVQRRTAVYAGGSRYVV